MKAMVLAAGVGSRLKPLTDSVPKALVEVGGAAMLERVLRRLMAAGVTGVVVNAHHHADKVAAFLEARKGFGLKYRVSLEPELLDTGGGLKKAAAFLDDGEPFFLHNADVLSEIDLDRMYRFHAEARALATLAVQDRPSGRGLLFDWKGLLRGWGGASPDKVAWAGTPVQDARRYAFCGIHVISPAIFPLLTEEGAFSINQAYLRLAGQGQRITAFRADGYAWQDIGTPEKLAAARRLFG